MPDVILNQPNQEYGTGDVDALVLTKYGGTVLEQYYNQLTVGDRVWVMPIEDTNTFQFPATAAATAEDLEEGVERTGANQPEVEERMVYLDSKQVISDHFLGESRKIVSHYSTQEASGRADAQACREIVERRLFAALALGARQSDRGTGDDRFPGGYQITAADSGAITAAYPATLSGSQALQAVIAAQGQRFDENNVAEGDRVAYLGPYLHRVLLLDKTLSSVDYTSPNNFITRTLKEVEGFQIVKSNVLDYWRSKSVDWSAYAQTRYQGDFRKTAAIFQGSREAVGQVVAMGRLRPFGLDWIKTKHSWYYGTKIWQGGKWLRPEALGELILQ